MKQRIIIGLSGASGVIYGIRTLKHLQTIENVETHLVMSEGASINTDYSYTKPILLSYKTYVAIGDSRIAPYVIYTIWRITLSLIRPTRYIGYKNGSVQK